MAEVTTVCLADEDSTTADSTRTAELSLSGLNSRLDLGKCALRLSDLVRDIELDCSRRYGRLTLDGEAHGVAQSAAHSLKCFVRELQFLTWVSPMDIDTSDLGDLVSPSEDEDPDWQLVLSPQLGDPYIDNNEKDTEYQSKVVDTTVRVRPVLDRRYELLSVLDSAFQGGSGQTCASPGVQLGVPPSRVLVLVHAHLYGLGDALTNSLELRCQNLVLIPPDRVSTYLPYFRRCCAYDRRCMEKKAMWIQARRKV